MINAKRVTFYDLFCSETYSQIRVPDYQRGYSWEKKHVKDFFLDLVNFSESDRYRKPQINYFLGPIVLMKGRDTEKFYFAVDGQQRLATFIILIAVMRDVAEARCGLFGSEFAKNIHCEVMLSVGPSGGKRWSLRLGDLDETFFETVIQNHSRNSGRIPSNKSNGNIKSAWNELEFCLIEKLDTENDPIVFLESLYNDLLHNVDLVAITVQGEREAMNVFQRINVRGKALSETDLIRHLMMSSCRQDDRSRLRTSWDRIVESLGKQNGKLDQFLKHMWVSRHGGRSSSKLYDEILEHLEQSQQSAFELVDDMLNDCNIYIELLKHESSELHHEGRTVPRVCHATLGFKPALPLFMAIYRRFGKSPRFSDLAKNIESVIIRYLYFANHDEKTLVETFNEMIASINDSPNKESAFESAVKKLKSVNPTASEVISGSQRRMTLKKIPAVYILREIENSLIDDSFRAHATLEHIYPQKADVREWGARVGRLDPYLSHIGNLTLLSSSDNSSAGNRSFSYKKKNVYMRSSLRITSSIPDNYGAWGRTPILRRSKELARLACSRWDLS